MGKWAQYSKRGSSVSGFTLAAPRNANWSLGNITNNSIDIILTAGFPAGADRWRRRRRVTGDPTWPVLGGWNVGTPLSNPGLVTLTSYDFQVQWGGTTGGVEIPLSPWSGTQTAVTL